MNQKVRSHDLKADDSVVTETDLKVSALIKEELSEFLASPEHILLDEEQESREDLFDQSKLDAAPFV